MSTEETPTSKQSRQRRFILERAADASDTSGTGVVAEGICFTGGKVALHWLSPHVAVTVFDSMDSVFTLHGHDGMTTIKWVDSEESVVPPRKRKKKKNDV
jgi:hypothetical protein